MYPSWTSLSLATAPPMRSCASRTRTRQPASARTLPAARPFGPAPMITASKSCMGGVVLCCLPGAWVGAMSRRVWVRGRIRLVRSDPQVAAGFQGGHGAWGPAGVGFVVQPLQHFGVVQFEGGSFGADPGQRLEVVPGWWAAGGPFQGVAVPPGVVGGGDFAVPQGPDDVPQERQHGPAEHEGADAGDGVGESESVGGQVVGVAAGHADDAEPVLDQEGDVESDEGGPEMQPTES